MTTTNASGLDLLTSHSTILLVLATLFSATISCTWYRLLGIHGLAIHQQALPSGRDSG